MVIVPQIELDNLGMADTLILMVMALVVFGPRRLPQIGRQIGKLMYEFRKASNDFKFQMEEELRLSEEADRRKKEETQPKLIASETPAPVNAIESQSESVVAQPVESPTGDVPRILPPSIGETVAAVRRVPLAETPPTGEVLDPMGQVEQHADAETVAPAANNDSAPATEAVSHNG